MLRFMRKRYNAGFVRGVRLGKMNERYRIIELLEKRYLQIAPDGKPMDNTANQDLLKVFELIKGETNE